MALFNLDAGESEAEPPELWALADVLAVACGGHAGTIASMERVVTFCASRTRPRLGAHPSYVDREGFGRRSMAISPDEISWAVEDQCSMLRAIAQHHGVRVEWVKPHGALYHDATASRPVADAVVHGAVAALGDHVAIIGPPRGELHAAATERGLVYLREGFADRRTREDGTLVPRTEPNALIADPIEAAARAVTIAKTVETICVHADTPGAFEIAKAVRAALDG